MTTIGRPWAKTSIAVAAAGFLAAAAGDARADGQVTVVNGGGGLMNALVQNFFGAYTEATGTELISVAAFTGEQFARVRAMENIGRIEWDVVTTTVANFYSEGELLEPLDCSRLGNLDQAIDGACTEHGLLRNLGATMVAWSNAAFPDGGPQNWQEFWDVERFPGPRCMMGIQQSVMMAIALLADGVPREDLYPLDIDRAIASLERIKPHASVWWTTGDQSQQTLRNGECVASVMWSGQIIPMVRAGEPFSFSWQDAVHISGYWSILRNAPNMDQAYEFLDFFLTRPEAHVGYFNATNYDTANRLAFAEISEEEASLHMSHPSVYPLTISEDWQALGPQMDEIRRRFTAFLAL